MKIDILVKIAEGLGKAIGSFISAFATEVMTILPTLGVALSSFMIAAQPFILLGSNIDGKLLKGAGVLAGAIVALTVANFISAVGSVLGLNLVSLGLKLSLFMIAAAPFISGLSQITPEMTAAAKNLAQLITSITVTSGIDGIASFCGVDLGGFGTKLATFGEGIKL